ncbi:lysine decarboxylase, partial [Staphylococcus agnetis]|nr:lysine decarboxylase [Staphylococcus agnetis]
WHEGDTFPMNALLHRIRQLNLPHSINHQLSMPNVLYKEEGVYMPDVFDRVRDVHYLDAEGTILAQHLIVYPPGIPTLLKGEKMNVSMIKLIDYWYKKGLRVEGLSEGKIKVKDD